MTRSDAPATYDDDFYAWTQAQAAAVRRLPHGVDGIDVEHLAEEIEDLGKRDLREVESYLRRLIEHLTKIEALPHSPSRSHWVSEALHFQLSAVAAFAPSMRRLIDVRKIWTSGQKLAWASLSDRDDPATKTAICPFTLDDLLSPEFDWKSALSRIASARSRD